MIRFTPCKINLGLAITRKRGDGFHNISSIFIPVPLYDCLEILPGDTKSMNLSCAGVNSACDPERNLVFKAWKLLHERYQIGGVEAFLYKCIPVGAGLGGGSSDAAMTLLILNEIFNIGLSKEALRETAMELGSDCAYFIDPKPAIVKGRGEIIEAINVKLSELWIRIIFPGIHMSTAEAYSGISRFSSELDLSKLNDLGSWESEYRNDFEESAFHRYPELQNIKQELLDEGAFYASMSGSGSAVFGLFSKAPGKYDGADFEWTGEV